MDEAAPGHSWGRDDLLRYGKLRALRAKGDKDDDGANGDGNDDDDNFYHCLLMACLNADYDGMFE